MTLRYTVGEPGRRWGEVRVERAERTPLDIEQIVAIQCAAAAGRSSVEISAELSIALGDVEHVITGERPWNPRRGPRRPRTAAAKVNFSLAKNTVSARLQRGKPV